MEIFRLFGSIFINNDEANRSIHNTSREAEKTGNVFSKLGGVTSNVATGVKKFGSIANKAAETLIKLGAAATTSLVGLGGVAVKIGMDYENAMSQVMSTTGLVGEEGAKAYSILSAAAKEAGATTNFSATQAAEALNYLALAGYNAEKSAVALPKVLKLAGAGAMDLGYASDLVTDSMSALGLKIEELDRFTDSLTRTSQRSNTSISQLGEAILTVGGTAKTLSGGVTEMNTVLGLLADNGVKGSEGGTALRNVINSLASPTDKARDVIEALGIAIEDTATGQMRPMSDIMSDFNTNLDAIGATSGSIARADYLNKIFDARSLKSVNALLGTSSERWAELSNEIENSAGATELAYDVMTDNLKGKFDILKSGLEGLAIQFYESIDNPLKGAIEKASGYVSELSNAFYENGLSGVISKVGGIVADIVIQVAEQAPLFIKVAISFIDSLVNGLLENSNRILEGALTAFTAIIDGIKMILPKLVPLSLDVLKAFISGFILYQEMIFTTGIDILLQLMNGMRERLPDLILQARKAITNIVTGLVNSLPEIVRSGIDIILHLALGIADTLPELIPIAVEAILVIVEALIDNIDKLIDAAIAIINGLAIGLIEALPILIEKAPVIIAKLIDALIENIPLLLKVSFEIVITLYKGIIDNLPMLYEAAGKIIWELIEGIVRFQVDIEKTSREIVGMIWTTISETNWLQLGKDIIIGMARGLTAGMGTIKDTISDVANSALDKAKNVLKIHSPSKIFADEIGKPIVEGIAEGIDENASTAILATEKMSKKIFENSKLWIENYRNSSDYSALEEIKMWEILAKKYSSVSKEKVEIDKNIAKLQDGILKEREDAEKAAFDRHKKLLELRKFFGVSSMQDEIDFWVDMTARYKDNAQLREEADKSLFEARKKLYEEQERITAKMEAAEQRYTQAVNDRAQAIFSSFGLFDQFSANEDKVVTALREATEEYNNVREALNKLQLQRLDASKTDEQLLDIAIEYAAKQKELAEASKKLNEAQLQANKTQAQLFSESLSSQIKGLAAWGENIKELTSRGLDESIIDELKKMGSSAYTEVENLTKSTDEQLTELNKLWQQKQALARELAVNELQLLRDETDEEIRLLADDLNKIARTDFVFAGENTVHGFIDGIKNKFKDLKDVMHEMADIVINTVTHSLEIASPSGLFRRFGKFTGLGFIEGIEDMGSAISGAVGKTFAFFNAGSADFKFNVGSTAALAAPALPPFLDNFPVYPISQQHNDNSYGDSNVTVIIENFNNNNNDDISTLSQKLAFYVNQEKKGRGVF